MNCQRCPEVEIRSLAGREDRGSEKMSVRIILHVDFNCFYVSVRMPMSWKNA
jgi:hypothetical protein